MSHVMHSSVEQIKINAVQPYWLYTAALLTVCCFCFLVIKNYNICASLPSVSRQIFYGTVKVVYRSLLIHEYTYFVERLQERWYESIIKNVLVAINLHLKYFRYCLLTGKEKKINHYKT